MQGNKSKNTQPEVAVRRLLHASGLRYRVGIRPVSTIRRTADIVFTRAKVAVFIDGCFWHGCAEHYVEPKSNQSYWLPKIAANRARDAETTALLEAYGWRVLRYWEHLTSQEVAQGIETAVRVPIVNALDR
jgi:DNA mismatch endonuclease (patch repair protein)